MATLTVFAQIAQALASAVPKIVKMMKDGRDIGDIKISEVISIDAHKRILEANDRAKSFIEG